MSLWRQLTHGLRALADRDAADADVADEVQHYVDQAVAAHLASGMSSHDARRAARLEVGSATRMREQVRGYGWENVIDTTLSDLRVAARRLRASPGFTVVTVLTLAIGIGATTAIFGAVDAILFQPLPYADPGRIMLISDHDADGARLEVTFGTFRELAVRNRSFASLAVMKPWQPTLTGRAEPERLDAQRVSADYFRTLGVTPLLGRDFDAADDRPRGPADVVISSGLWQQQFGGAGDIVGRQVRLDGEGYMVIGVMPPGFEGALYPPAQLWTLLQFDASLPSFQDPGHHGAREWGHQLGMVGRLRPAIGVDQATREIAQIARTPVPEFARPAWATLAQGLIAHRLHEELTSAVRPSLLAMLGAVVLVLMISCVNVTSLLLARGVQRHGEFAMRAALGASRARIVRLLLSEGVLLATIGGVLGLFVAELGVHALVAFSPPEWPRVSAIRIDGSVFAFAAGVTTLCGLLVGLLPALHGTRTDLQTDIRRSPHRTAGGLGTTRGILVVAEVALALVLLVSAGLLVRSMAQLFAVSPGFDPSRVVTMQVQTSGHPFDDDGSRARFFSEVLAAVRRVPGVAAAAMTSQLPMSGELDGYGVHLESSPSTSEDGDNSALRYAVSPGYFETMGIPLRRGRSLNEHDVAGRPVAVLVSASLARSRFGDADPIGRRFRYGPDTSWDTIVGVVGDVKQTSLAVSQPDAVYLATSQWLWVDLTRSLVVRGRGDAAALVPAIKAAIWSVDKDQPVVRVTTMDALLARSAAGRRLALVVFELFGAVALVLAAIGLYGVVAGSVTERMREIGVRSALGASPADILGLVVRQGMTLTLLGIGIGLVGAGYASRALATLLFGVSRLDPIAYVVVVALVVGVSTIACWVPARRAAGGDPLTALRAE